MPINKGEVSIVMYLKKLRYDDLTDEEFNNFQMQHFQFLLKMPFGAKSCLLKYFGYSFFHDGRILGLSVNPDKKSVYFDISSENFIEDINYYRVHKGLATISSKEYWKNPIIFHFIFSQVTHLSATIELNECRIMDTEILSYDKSRGYELSIQLEDGNDISFFCRGVRVSEDHDLIGYYTGGLKRIPYCSTCRLRLLTKRALEALVKG